MLETAPGKIHDLSPVYTPLASWESLPWWRKTRSLTPSPRVTFKYYPVSPHEIKPIYPQTIAELPECLKIRADSEFVDDPDEYFDQVKGDEITSQFSRVNAQNKTTEKLATCIAVLATGIDTDGQNLSLLVHIALRDLNEFNWEAVGPWRMLERTYTDHIDQLAGKTIAGSRSVTFIGGRFRDQSWDELSHTKDKLAEEYQRAIHKMRFIHEGALGVKSQVFQPKMYRGKTSVYYDNDQMTAHIVETGQLHRTSATIGSVTQLDTMHYVWNGQHSVKPVTWEREFSMF